jgi:renalase
MVDVLVIGAGMSGLCAAGALRSAGIRVRILDKGRGVGGRMATRRIGGATFDHGAQFATAEGEPFREWLREATRAGVAAEWASGVSFLNGLGGGPDRWRGVGGMAAFAKYLARGLEVHLGREVAAVRRAGEHWRVELGDGSIERASAIVLTAPIPQALALLDAGGQRLDADLRERLSGISYEYCLAVMAVLRGPSRLPEPGGLAFSEGPVAWIADNQQKGISESPALTVHASDAWSRLNWDRDRMAVGEELLGAVASWMGSGVERFEVHGWRYSRPVETFDCRCLVLEGGSLVLAGDAFGGRSVEGAALSGWAAAEALMERRNRG